MTRIFPQPFHTLLLTAVWLLLNNSMSLGHILLGLILGIVIPIVCQPLRIPQPKIAKPFKLIPYVLVVLKDVIIANIEVAILVLGPVKRIQPGFIAYPLTPKDDLEGVDLPGDYCSHVIIAKLPFAAPDDPIDAAHAELLESAGRNPFM